MKFILGVSISVIFLLLFFRIIDFSVASELIQNFNITYLIASLIFLLISSLLRIYRWYALMGTLAEGVTFKQCISPMIGSLALNGILPFRGGDVARVFIFSNNMKVRKSSVMASMVVERILDLIIILALLIFSILLINFTTIPDWLSKSVTLISIFILAVLFVIMMFRKTTINILERLKCIDLLSRSPSANKIINFLIDTLVGLGKLMGIKNILLMIMHSLLIWLAQAGVFLFLILGLTDDYDFIASLFSSSVVAISTVIPSSPGYFGSFHYAALISFDLIYQNKNLGGAYAIISHAVFWLPTTIIGLIMLIIDKNYLNILDKVYNTK